MTYQDLSEKQNRKKRIPSGYALLLYLDIDISS